MNIRGYNVELRTDLDTHPASWDPLLDALLLWHGSVVARARCVLHADKQEEDINDLVCYLIDRFDEYLRKQGLRYSISP